MVSKETCSVKHMPPENCGSLEKCAVMRVFLRYRIEVFYIVKFICIILFHGYRYIYCIVKLKNLFGLICYIRCEIRMIVRRVLKVVETMKRTKAHGKIYEYRYGMVTVTVPEELIGKRVEVIVVPVD